MLSPVGIQHSGLFGLALGVATVSAVPDNVLSPYGTQHSQALTYVVGCYARLTNVDNSTYSS
jgi:hypothetical protein